MNNWVRDGADPREPAQQPVRGELANLREYLRAYRLTLELKCEDLTPEQLATASVPPSDLSLLGLIRHMARVEHHWFRRVLDGQAQLVRLQLADDGGDASFDLPANPDQADVDSAFAQWRAEIAFADAWLAADPAVDLSALAAMPNGEQLEVRDVLIHMIEEYARHCGHADLIRERIDGRTGQ